MRIWDAKPNILRSSECFLSSFSHMPGYYFKLTHDSFLSHPLKFIITIQTLNNIWSVLLRPSLNGLQINKQTNVLPLRRPVVQKVGLKWKEVSTFRKPSLFTPPTSYQPVSQSLMTSPWKFSKRRQSNPPWQLAGPTKPLCNLIACWSFNQILHVVHRFVNDRAFIELHVCQLETKLTFQCKGALIFQK